MLKKLALLFTALLFLNISILAQETFIGFKAGVNIAKLNFSSKPEGMTIDNRLGFTGGLSLSHYFTESISLCPELFFLQHGAKFEQKELNQKTDLKLNYLSLPVTINYNFPIDGKIKPRIFAGPQIGYLLSANESIKINERKNSNKDQKVKDKFKKLDVGFQAGIGVDFKFHSNILSLEAAYLGGLTNISDNYSIGKIKSRGILLSFNAKFPLN